MRCGFQLKPLAPGTSEEECRVLAKPVFGPERAKWMIFVGLAVAVLRTPNRICEFVRPYAHSTCIVLKSEELVAINEILRNPMAVQ
jgi:hypothetical protein